MTSRWYLVTTHRRMICMIVTRRFSFNTKVICPRIYLNTWALAQRLLFYLITRLYHILKWDQGLVSFLIHTCNARFDSRYRSVKYFMQFPRLGLAKSRMEGSTKPVMYIIFIGIFLLYNKLLWHLLKRTVTAGTKIALNTLVNRRNQINWLLQIQAFYRK